MSTFVEEGRALMEKGKKSLNGSSFFGLVKSKPDYDLACHNFDQAAVSFKNGRSWEECLQAYEMASDCYRHLDSLPLAGKALESAATVANLNARNMTKAVDLYLRSSDYYAAAGNVDKGVENIEKASKLLEASGEIDRACEIALKACDVYEREDKPRMAAETFRRTLSTLVKHRRLQLATSLIPRLAEIYTTTSNTPQLFKLYLSSVVIHLASGDEAGAKRCLEGPNCNPSFANSEESSVANSILDSWFSGDDEELDKLKQKGVIKLLDNEIIKLVNSLQLPGGRPKKKKEAPVATGMKRDVSDYQVGESAKNEITAADLNEGPNIHISASANVNLEEDDDLGIC